MVVKTLRIRKCATVLDFLILARKEILKDFGFVKLLRYF